MVTTILTTPRWEENHQQQRCPVNLDMIASKVISFSIIDKLQITLHRYIGIDTLEMIDYDVYI